MVEKMKNKKVLNQLTKVLGVSLLAFSVFSGKVFAETKTFGLEEYRKADSQGKQTGYAFDISKKIWKVVTYSGSTPNYDKSIYCIKAEQGFYSYTNGTEFDKVDYNLTYDFKNKSAMSGIGLPVPSQYYSQILWILDHAYVPSSSTAAEERTFLLQQAGIPSNTEITDDDIDAIQQMAIWYFTNYNDTKYHDDDPVNGPILKPIKFSTKTGVATTEYTNINDYDMYRYDDMYTLYQYLINTANANSNYVSVTQAPISLDSQSPVVEESGENYIIGPYRINQNNDLPYTITEDTKFTTGEGSNLTGYTLLNENKSPVSSGTTIADLVGKNFYISIPKGLQVNGEKVEKVKFNLSANYKTTTVDYWTKAGDNTVQPLVIVEKQTLPITAENTVDIPEEPIIVEKEFDLALRKFISKVGNVAVNREPQVDTTNLNKVINGIKQTTAVYNHSKVPVNVKVGDEVIYTIRIYNEGEQDGYASEVTDYLPPELEFINDDFNANYGWTCLETGDVDGQIVRRIRTNFLAKGGVLDKVTPDRPNGALLSAYNEETGELDYIDLQVKCRVRDTAQSKDKITNIAEVTKQTDAKGNNVTDRDSVPHNVVLPNDKDLPYYKEEEINSGKSYIPGQQDDDDFEKLKVEVFDLALRKFISGKNGVAIIGREPKVDVTNLANGTKTTAIYNHTKVALDAQRNDVITYTIRVYNEGDIDGYANIITDHLPPELEFLPEEEINKKYEWQVSEDGRTITTTYLSKEKETASRENLIEAFDGTRLDYKEVKVSCKIKDTAAFGKKLTNLAEVTQAKDKDGQEAVDRDSETDNQVLPADKDLPEYKEDEIDSGKTYIPGQEDDDDFEKVRIVYFDLALRKFITAVDNTGITNRIPQLSIGEDGNIHYEHTKEPVEVRNGNIVTYTIRVYNEGLMDGYAASVVDDIPEGMEFLPENETNIEYRWVLSEDGKKLTTDYLSKEQEKTTGANLIKAFNPEKGISENNPDYRDVKIAFKVTEPNNSDRVLVNTAEIADDRGPTNEPVDDIDSTPGNNNEWNKEDDLDKEFVKLKEFDLALRKFITAVDDTEITNRIPQLSIGEDGNIHYEHTKEPVEVMNGNIVTYTIRVYNEGQIDGYAAEVADDVPEGLEFLPENETNKGYRWKLSEDGKKLTTDYLSKEQEKEEGANLIKAFDSEKGISENNPDYRDVKIAFKITEPNTSDRILVNTAEIADDRDPDNKPVDDIDSTPGNDNEWNKEDDLDKEFVKVKYFDLALKKWVSKVILIEEGKETVTETGHTGDENPEPVVKVELHRKKLDKVTVKFEYQVKVTNEGEIAGYVKELKDYIPEGLKFLKEDNSIWKQESENVVTTTALEDVLLQPGQSASVPIILTWINDANNLGIKTNIAEISKDYNDADDTPDIDSTPDNKVPGEDDIDDAPVMLAVETGKAETYLGLGFIILVTIAGGIILIKKFVL